MVAKFPLPFDIRAAPGHPRHLARGLRVCSADGLAGSYAAWTARSVAASRRIERPETSGRSLLYAYAPVTPEQWQLVNASLKPLLIDMLDYIIGLGNITAGIETWRGDRVDPALVWLARHGTDTTT